ncbi:MAG: hypothetical protein Tsb005_04920 [Gammaproteobacteria bacterium]
MKIIIHAFINENSLPYFKYMLQNYCDLARDADLLEFHAYCLSKNLELQLSKIHRVTEIIPVYKQPQYFVKQTLKDQIKSIASYLGIHFSLAGSNGHAAGLNAAFKRTGKAIDIIADVDTLMLVQGWEQYVVEWLKIYGVVATSYENIGGISSGVSRQQTYKNKPSLTWLALSPRYDFTRLNADPDKRSNIVINTDELSELYQLPLNYELVRDVGWKMPVYLQQNNIPFLVFQQIKPSAQNSVLKTGLDYHEEYHIDDMVFLAHQRGSHQHPFRGNDISTRFYNAYEKFVADIS